MVIVTYYYRPKRTRPSIFGTAPDMTPEGIDDAVMALPRSSA